MYGHHPLKLLAICFGLAFLFAITWVVVMTLTLPPTDGAHGQMPFDDPLVFPIMSILASIAAILIYPFTYFAFRDRSLLKALGILAAAVLIEIFIVTPLNAGLGFLGAFGAYATGLVVGRQASAPNKEQRQGGLRPSPH